MATRVGDKIPDVTLKTLNPDGVQDVSTRELCAGKQVVLIGVPGAFTPTCSDTHLPGFVARADDLRAKGADVLACVSVNDAFVMGAWGKAREADGKVMMLADGNGDLAKAMGLDLDLTGFGMGERSLRYAAIIDDGVIRLLNVETGRGVGVSSAETVLEAL